ncbi:DUF2523 domain-containing protein [Vibrio parahaemolyticus]|nr:DUF2523 domain-containing protein [Vibrio parahaemolyticus]
MPILQLIYTLIAKFFGEGLYKILIKAGTALSVGALTYSVSDDITAKVSSLISSEFGALDSDLYSLFAIAGGAEIINILIAYMTMLVTLTITEKVIK